ncbi:MAG: RNA polymerase subunit sigma [Candidatus Melainabacteria bacterium HGW-Melainabacteria-1]|nr:MAG: RNA polymerase subunit sigma [Candidatus Melainabacteria bacterium HGW-Melainabacteria-1]
MTEQELQHNLLQARQGDKQAFRRLVDYLMPRLYAVVYAIIPDTDEVYDILQDSFVKAYRGLPGLRKPEAFVGWMTRIAVNTARSRVTRRREFATEPDALVFTQLASPEKASQALEQQELQQLLQRALQQLSPEHREVVALVELEELSCAEAAKLLECPPGTVRSRLHYARKRLQELLAPYRSWLFREESAR